MWQFEPTEEQQHIEQAVLDFARQHILPYYKEWDEKQIFPRELFKELGKMGFMGVVIPEKYGGSGLSYQDYVTVVDALSRIDPSVGLSVAAHNSLCTNHIYEFGNEEQRMQWLPKLASGEWIGAWCLTEHNTGSDAGAMSTTAKEEGDYYVLNGAKNFITHGKSAEVLVVLARTAEKNTKNNATAFVVERGTPGLYAGKKENKLGMRASETAEVIFDNVKVPRENVLGKVGEGFKQALKILDGGRISIGANALGIAKGAYQAALQYSKERYQFGRPISSFQAIAFMLADMAMEIDASEMLIRRAAYLKDLGLRMTKEGAMAKLYASEVSVRVSNNAVQIFGGYGYTKDFPVEKFYRDSKLTTIGEGTSEIQRLVISRQILK